jgi:hypothetical protein
MLYSQRRQNELTAFAADDPEDVIVTTARRLDRGNFPITQVGIQFVQIGQSPGAAEFLQELDDNLTSNYGVRVSRAVFHRM